MVEQVEVRKKPGPPPMPADQLRRRISMRVSPKTLEFLESLPHPNMGRALDEVIKKYRRRLRQAAKC